MMIISGSYLVTCFFIIAAVTAQKHVNLDTRTLKRNTSHTGTSVSSKPGKPRIVGGTSVNIIDYPYMVSMRWSRRHTCGGSIYKPDWVLTAAHCVLDVSKGTIDGRLEKRPVENITVWAGENNARKRFVGANAQERKAWKTFAHQYYTNISLYPDIGLIKLDTPFKLSDRAQLTKLPPRGQLEVPAEKLVECYVTGWGFITPVEPGGYYEGTVPKTLQRIKLVLSNKEQCEIMVGFALLECEFCSSVDANLGKDPCGGDSGGPLVCEGFQQGIVSAGSGCGWPGRAGVFTRVSCLEDWITEIVSNEDAGGLHTAWWVVIAVILILAVVLSIVLGCIIYKAYKSEQTN